MKNILILFALMFSGVTIAQSGIIEGTIINSSTKQPVPAANVLVLDTDYGAASNNDGYFRITGLTPGLYRIRVSSIGYNSLVLTDIQVTNSRPATLRVNLDEAAIEIEGVTVVSDYFYEEAADVTSTTTFSYEEIRRSAGGFEDVIRALSVLPGIGQASAGRNDLIVRGGSTFENLYILDGYEIPNINHFGSQGATGGPLSYINLDFVSSTTFSSGGFPVNYGDKLSSVLRIDLRDGRSDKIGGKATISASQFGLNLEGPLSEKSTFIFSARRSYLDFIFKAAGFGFVPEYYDLLTKYDWNPDTKNRISFLFLGAFDNVKFFNDTEDQRYDNSRILGSNQTQYATGISYRRLIVNGYFRISLSRNFTDYDTQQRDSLLNPIFLNLSSEADDRLKTELFYQFSKKNEVTIGFEADRIKTKYDIYFPNFKTSFGEILPIDSLKTEETYYKGALFMNYTLKVMPHFVFNFGVRGDYFSGIDQKFSFNPRFSAEYKISDVLSYNLSVGKYSQSPSYIWLAGEKSNSSLKPINVNQYVTGFEYRVREDLLAKIEGFYKDYSDYPVSLIRNYLILSNTGAGYEGSDDNFSSFGLEPLISGGKGFARGIELSLQKKLSEIPLYGILSITISEAKYEALDGILRPGTYDQTLLFNLSGGYKFDESWEISSKFRFATGRPYTPFNSDGTQTVANYNSGLLPETHALDIRVDKKWFFEKFTLITYIDVQNVYGRNNVNAVRWDRREQKEDRGSSIGVLPSIGVSLEF